MTRHTRRSLERKLDELTETPDDVATLTVSEFLSYEYETVDAERGLVRLVETGELRAAPSPDNPGEAVREALSPDSDVADST